MNIKAGDLVVVVRPSVCCGSLFALGKVFTVHEVEAASASCRHCSHVDNKISMALIGPGTIGVTASRLKKIDPPSACESESERKELVTA